MKHKKVFCLSLAAVMAFSVAALAACGGKEEEPPKGPEAKGSLVPTENYAFPDEIDAQLYDNYINGRQNSGSVASVHDPSVFYDEASETYYAFGTHYAVASSENLVEWKQEVKDNEWKKLYGTEAYTKNGTQWPMAIKDTVDLVNPEMNNDPITTTWAPDVNYHDGKYYMYYSLTSYFGSSKSAIARVESDNVLGPYTNNKILFSSDGSGKSNAIDPELFTDKDGGLWMVYGSTFGGIFIVELENSGENWGLPKETPEAGKAFGKNIWATGNNVEGPFVFYNPLNEYYYLMTSYGALMYSYNMRIARSKNPDGPYEDVTGQLMTDVKSNGSGGNKVAGSYKFALQGTEQGYAAMGHNSVVQSEDGRWFVIYHARRQGTFTADDEKKAGVTSGHSIRVSQLFFNEDGWPVMSPTFYVGEKFGLITQEEAAGDYQIVVHSQGITAKPVASVNYTLSADGKVKQGTTEKGTWSIKDSFYVTITIDEVEYKGVIVPGWDSYTKAFANQKPVFAITAISSLTDAKQGGSLWAISPREA